MPVAVGEGFQQAGDLVKHHSCADTTHRKLPNRETCSKCLTVKALVHFWNSEVLIWSSA